MGVLVKDTKIKREQPANHGKKERPDIAHQMFVVRATLFGDPATTYAVQASDSLTAPNWAAIGTGQPRLDGKFSYLDPNAPGRRLRFYRLAAIEAKPLRPRLK